MCVCVLHPTKTEHHTRSAYANIMTHMWGGWSVYNLVKYSIYVGSFPNWLNMLTQLFPGSSKCNLLYVCVWHRLTHILLIQECESDINNYPEIVERIEASMYYIILSILFIWQPQRLWGCLKVQINTDQMAQILVHSLKFSLQLVRSFLGCVWIQIKDVISTEDSGKCSPKTREEGR